MCVCVCGGGGVGHRADKKYIEHIIMESIIVYSHSPLSIVVSLVRLPPQCIWSSSLVGKLGEISKPVAITLNEKNACIHYRQTHADTHTYAHTIRLLFVLFQIKLHVRAKLCLNLIYQFTGLDYKYAINTFPFLLYNREDKSVPSIFVSLGSSAPAILNMVGRRSSVDASWCVRP